MKCDGCHLESEREEIFKDFIRFFSRKDLKLCPACFEEKNNRIDLVLIWSYVSCGFLSIPLILFYPTRGVGLLFLIFSVALLFILISTVLHELGHALFGQLFGIRVFAIQIGKGGVVYEFNFGGIRWRICVIAFGGVTIGVPYSAHLFRLRELLFVLGGPMTNVILIVFAIKFLSFDQIFKSTIFDGFVPMQLLLLSNGVLLVMSLWPNMANSVVGKTPSDGLLLWKIWWYDKTKVEEILAARYLYEAEDCRLRKDLVGTENWIKEGLRQFPNNFLLKITAAGVLHLKKKYPEALRSYALLVGRDKKNKDLDSLILNNYAYNCLLIGKPELLPKADVCSRLALKHMPWVVYCKGTRGSVLVELSRYDEGLKLLHEAMRTHPDKWGRALNACYIGIAEARRGNHSESRNYFSVARRLDPDCILLEREQKTS